MYPIPWMVVWEPNSAEVFATAFRLLPFLVILETDTGAFEFEPALYLIELTGNQGFGTYISNSDNCD